MTPLQLGQMVKNAERPFFLAGHGLRLSGERELFLRVVSQFEIPFMVTSHGKGYLPEDSPLFLGAFGLTCPPENEQKIRSLKPDLIVTLGTRLGEFASLGWSETLAANTTLIQVLDNPRDFSEAYPSATKATMNLRDFLEALISLADDETTAPFQSIEFKNDLTWIDDLAPIAPLKLIRCLEHNLPHDGLLISDLGNSIAWTVSHLRVATGREYYVPIGLASMGTGIGAAIGAKLASPHRAVFCLSGDCSVLMYGNDIFTAKEHGAGVVLIVLNDGGHGMVDHGHKLIGLPNVKVRFKEPVDFQKWAEGFGIESYRVQTTRELNALPWGKWKSSNTPVVVDVRIDESVIPPIKSRARVLGQGEQLEPSEDKCF